MILKVPRYSWRSYGIFSLISSFPKPFCPPSEESLPRGLCAGEKFFFFSRQEARASLVADLSSVQMELEILHQQIAVRKQVEAEHALSLQPSPEHSPTILEPISPGSVLSNLLTGLLSPSPRPSADRSPALCSPRVNLSPASPTKIYKIPAPALETIEETHKETDGSPRDADGHVSHPNQGTNKAAVKQPPLQRNPRKVEGMQHVLGVHMQIGTPNSPDWRVTL